MPQLKQDPDEAYKKQVANLIRCNVEYYQKLRGMDFETIARSAHMSEKTLHSRLREPEKFTVKELLGLAIRYKRPITVFFEE